MGKDKRLITKVRYGQDKVSANYLVEHPDGRQDEYSVICTDQPLAEFDAALQALLEEMPDWCEISQEGYFDNAKVLGVSYSWKHGIMGAVVTLTRPLRHCGSPLVLNAPHKTEAPYSEGGDYSVCLTKEQADALKKVITECDRYLDGQRAQMELPLAI